jgi:hypothetical protein
LGPMIDEWPIFWAWRLAAQAVPRRSIERPSLLGLLLLLAQLLYHLPADFFESQFVPSRNDPAGCVRRAWGAVRSLMPSARLYRASE